MSGPLIGFIVSIVAIIALSVSLYWAATKEVKINNPTTEDTYNEEVVCCKIQTVANRIPKSAVMTQASAAMTMGSVPGNFNSKYNTTLSIAQYTTDFLSTASITKMLGRVQNGEDRQAVVDEHFKSFVGQPYPVETSRAVDTVIDTEKSTTDEIVYTSYNTFVDTIDNNYQITTVNYEGLNLWWQMQNLPTFMKAWQSFSQIANKMYTQNFQNFMYAHYMYASPNFNETSFLNGTVFQNLTTPLTDEEKQWIYADTQYGMMSTRNLTIWVASSFNDAAANTKLTSHWFSGKYQITQAQLTLITGTGTVFATLSAALKAKIVTTGELTEPQINNQNLSALQWAKGNLLNNPSLAFNTTYTKQYNSMADIGMNFIAQPEITQSGCDSSFTYLQGVALFNQNLADNNQASLLSPSNYFTFQNLYETNKWSTIQGTFGLSQPQATCIYSYAFQQSDYNTYQAYANMLAQTVHTSLYEIGKYFPVNIAARTVAYRSKNSLPSANTCTTMLAAIVPAVTNAVDVCNTYSMTNITDVQLFASGTWYNDYSGVISLTGWTEAQVTSFYNWNTTGSFGSALKLANEYNYDKYSCPSAMETQYQKNCSAPYIAAGQWGASWVTLNPPYTNTGKDGDDYYWPEFNLTDGSQGCLTISNWTVPGISDQAPEYFYYSQFLYKPSAGAQGAPAFTPWEVANLTDDSYSYFGLNNTYNAKMAYYYYSIENVDNVVNQYMNDTVQAFGLNSKTQLYNFFGTMDWMIQDYLLGGLIAKRSLKDLVLGWNSALINKFAFKPEIDYNDYYYKTGDAILYNAHVTPMLDGTQVLRSKSNPEIAVNSGASDATKTGRISNISGYNYPNRMFKVFNGQSSFVYLPFRCSNANFTSTDIFSWAQGQPNITASNPKVLNLVNMQVTEQNKNVTVQLCAEGRGDDCRAVYNTVNSTVFEKTAQFYPSGNCGTRIFAHGTGSQQNTQDEISGMPTEYGASGDNYLSYDALSTEAPGTNGPQMLHPFAGLKALYQNLGANQQVQLNTEVQSYAVDPTPFLNVEYPSDATNPTKEVNATYLDKVINGSITTDHYSNERQITVWVLVLYIILIIVFIVVAVVLLQKIRKEGAAADLAGSITYDNIEDKNTPMVTDQ